MRLLLPLLLALALGSCAPAPQPAKPPHLREREAGPVKPPPAPEPLRPPLRPAVRREGPPPSAASVDALLRELHHRIDRLERDLRRPGP